MESTLIGLLAFLGVVVFLVVIICIIYLCTNKKKVACSTRDPHTAQILEETSGGQPASGKTASGELIDASPTTLHTPTRSGSYAARSSGSVSAIKTKSTISNPEKSSAMDGGRLKIKQFKHVGMHKRFTRLGDGPLIHAFSNVPRKHCPVPKILTKEIKGEIMMYSPDFNVPLPLVAAGRRKSEIIEQHYHLSQPVLDAVEYRRKRFDSLNLPEMATPEGNHEKVKNIITDGTPFLEIKPHLAKMPAKRDDTTRHFILNTQYAARFAIRFVCASGRYVSIPSHEIIEPCGRLRVLIVANCDMDEQQTEKESVYYEYIQVPERSMDPQNEFMKRPVIGRINLRLFPCFLNLSPNTFYPSSRRKTTVYTSTLSNTGKSPCKFSWPDERDVVVSPQNGFIKPQSSVQFTFTPKKPVTLHAINVEMKYALNDRPSAHGTISVRFETADMKRLIQLSTKALAACDTAEDPGYFG